MRVSVIIPAWNAARYLADAIASVQAQTHTDIEIIAVDDGSTDDTPGILRRLALTEPRLRIVTRPNGGLSAARNSGIEAATGRYILFLDADDMLHPLAIEHLLTAASRLQTGIVIRSLWNVSTEPPASFLPPSGDAIPARALGNVSPRIIAEPRSALLYQSEPIGSACAALIPASALTGPDGLRFAEGLYYEDLEFCERLYSRVSGVALIEEELYFYRQNPASFIHTFTGRRLDVLTVTRMILERVPEYLLGAARDRRFAAAFNMYLLLGSLPRDKRRLYENRRHECWEIIRGGRRTALADPNVRRRNKLGALLSYLGPGLTLIVGRITGR